jgi:hypothetical protein
MLKEETALVALFVCADDFCKAKNLSSQHVLGKKSGLALSEIWTIYALFQMSGMRNFMGFYEGLHEKYLKKFSPKCPPIPPSSAGFSFAEKF